MTHKCMRLFYYATERTDNEEERCTFPDKIAGFWLEAVE